jgi:DNA end-binding protein Ku
MAARAIWSGSISFGLVNIPVKMHTAVREKRIGFNLLHDQDKVRLRMKMVCPAHNNVEVHPEHRVRGYEISKDHYVLVQQDELEACAPEKSKTIEITDFVELAQIDPIYYDRTYYLTPDENAAKPYRLLYEALEKSKRVGIARLVMHEKEYLVALRPQEDVLCLYTMHFHDEVVPKDQLGDLPHNKPNDRELKAADRLIDSLMTDFKPEQYHDEYRDCVMKMIHKKAHGEEIVVEKHHEKKPGKTTDLIAALEASLAKAKSHAEGRGKRGAHGRDEGESGEEHHTKSHRRKRKAT